MRDQVDIAQIISWNGGPLALPSRPWSPVHHLTDYGESHYLGPIKGAQPNSQAWVDGFPHEPWLQLNSYFAFAFKNGHYPKVHQDKIFVWGRPHPKAATASHDSVPRPNNWELVGISYVSVEIEMRVLISVFLLYRQMTSFGSLFSPLRQARYVYHRGNTQSHGISRLDCPNYLTDWNLTAL